MVSMDNLFELPDITTFGHKPGNGHGGGGFKSGDKSKDSSENKKPGFGGFSNFSFMGYRITTDGELVK